MTRETYTRPDRLYNTDNGAIYCGDHCGSSARFTGRDISGQKIEEVNPGNREEWCSCESCGMRADASWPGSDADWSSVDEPSSTPVDSAERKRRDAEIIRSYSSAPYKYGNARNRN